MISVTATAPDLRKLLAQGPIDAALIDINLRGNISYDFARQLAAEAIPFAFLTGYDAGVLPEDLSTYECMSKPADAARVVATLVRLTGQP